MKNLPSNGNSSRENKLALINSFEESSSMQWVGEHAQSVIWGIIGAILIIATLFFWYASKSSQAEADYYNAYQDFQQFQSSALSGAGLQAQDGSFQKLEALLQRRPDLHAKYDGLIAQTLIDQNEVAIAKPFAEATLKRVSAEDLPFYVDYSSTTLLSLESRNKEALERSLALREQMLKSAAASQENSSPSSFGSILYAFNLLRIALLQKEVGSPEEEIKAWQEWKRYTNVENVPMEGIDTAAFFAVANLFNEGQISLVNYVDERLKVLQN